VEHVFISVLYNSLPKPSSTICAFSSVSQQLSGVGRNNFYWSSGVVQLLLVFTNLLSTLVPDGTDVGDWFAAYHLSQQFAFWEAYICSSFFATIWSFGHRPTIQHPCENPFAKVMK
jgi:hypothetical protein